MYLVELYITQPDLTTDCLIPSSNCYKFLVLLEVEKTIVIPHLLWVILFSVVVSFPFFLQIVLEEAITADFHGLYSFALCPSLVPLAPLILICHKCCKSSLTTVLSLALHVFVMFSQTLKYKYNNIQNTCSRTVNQ